MIDWIYFIFIYLQLMFDGCTDGLCTSFYMGCCPDTVWNASLKSCVDCPTGFTGMNCTERCVYPYFGKRCHDECKCIEEVCDYAKGCHLEHCPPGYTGLNCTDQCVFPYFGKRCHEECKCNEEVCDHTIGCLLELCPPEYGGMNCTERCVYPYLEQNVMTRASAMKKFVTME